MNLSQQILSELYSPKQSRDYHGRWTSGQDYRSSNKNCGGFYGPNKAINPIDVDSGNHLFTDDIKNAKTNAQLEDVLGSLGIPATIDPALTNIEVVKEVVNNIAVSVQQIPRPVWERIEISRTLKELRITKGQGPSYYKSSEGLIDIVLSKTDEAPHMANFEVRGTKATMIHEVGHALHATQNLDSTKLLNKARQQAKDGDIYYPSSYSKTNHMEFFAEAFATKYGKVRHDIFAAPADVAPYEIIGDWQQTKMDSTYKTIDSLIVDMVGEDMVKEYGGQ